MAGFLRMPGPDGPRIASGLGRAHLTRVKADDTRREEREELVRAVEASTGVYDERIAAAFRDVPREAFVPREREQDAYEDCALPIGERQTISQPSMIALMLHALEPVASDRALEVGAGSGYAAALLGRLVRSVLAIEIIPELAEPFDVILVSAGAPAVPEALVEELAPGGRIAIPVGERDGQHLYVGRRGPDGAVAWEQRTACVFVPLVGGG
jgi:protein-L-isoaspartate(D-aspartate) O-methyltransferase